MKITAVDSIPRVEDVQRTLRHYTARYTNNNINLLRAQKRRSQKIYLTLFEAYYVEPENNYRCLSLLLLFILCHNLVCGRQASPNVNVVNRTRTKFTERAFYVVTRRSICVELPTCRSQTRD